MAKHTYTSDTRIYGIDALRGITMVLGIVLHASIAYKVVSLPNWPYDNAFRNRGFDLCYHFIHSFRMPLFFLIAGYFSRMLIRKIGIPAFVRHRFKRIFLPFVFSVVLLLPFTSFPFIWFEYSKHSPDNFSNAWQAIAKQSVRWNGLAHLWFLYYLVVFYGVYIAYHWVRQQKGRNAPVNESAGSWRYHLIFSLLLLAGLFACIYHSPVGVVGIDTSAFPQIRVIGYYFLFFVAGLYVQKNPLILPFFARWHILLLALGIAAGIGLFQAQLACGDKQRLMLVLLSMATTLLLTAGITGMFLVHFNVNNPLWKYLSDAAYWMSPIHLGIVGFLQVMLTYSTVPGSLRFMVVLSLTILITLASYQWLVRYTFIGTLLHGERKKPKVTEKPLLQKEG